MEDLGGLVKTLRGGHFSPHEAACGAERLFFNAFSARRPLTWCVRTLARIAFSWRRGTHACDARALRPSCTAVKRERLATPTMSQPCMRGLPHIPHIAMAHTPFLPTPLTRSKKNNPNWKKQSGFFFYKHPSDIVAVMTLVFAYNSRS